MTASRTAHRLLEVRDLTVEYAGGSAALNDISFDIHPGEIVGIVGESGAGKTTVGLAVLRLLPPHGRVVRGSISFRGRDVLGLSERELRAFRGREVAMLPQEADLAANPYIRTLGQVEEVIRAHRTLGLGQRREEARKVLAELEMSSPRLLAAYPHELSGGERQRLIIAQAIACEPALLIADEPSSSLDVVLQSQWLEMIRSFRDRLGGAVLLITHNPSVLSALADRVLVMYHGQIVEEGAFEAIARHPLHPYTDALLRSVPPFPGRVGQRKHLPALAPYPGTPKPSEAACAFEPRCPDRMMACSRQKPPLAIRENLQQVRCLKYE
ncbi:MAG TPA: ABC transporter ATP-binding protein [Bryobacteraceae bacterium]|nr:ABC transporter ATP-binding protein [Bryobacteraceae bacterium]